VRAAAEGALKPINAAVDACNAVSLHSGLPISVVEFDRARPPFHIAVAPIGTSYIFSCPALWRGSAKRSAPPCTPALASSSTTRRKPIASRFEQREGGGEANEKTRGRPLVSERFAVGARGVSISVAGLA
jgi:hypothetical protein